MADLLTGFYFNVKITGIGSKDDMAFQEVTGIEKELKTDEVVCGGENRFKYKLPAGITSPNLVLKRGASESISPLILWCKETLDTGSSLPILTKDIQVQLLNKEGECCLSWDFISAYPVKWSSSGLNSQEGNVFIETIEMAYQYFDISPSLT